MHTALTATNKHVLGAVSVLGIGLSLCDFASLSMAGTPPKSFPVLDTKKLKRAYRPHLPNKVVTVSPPTWSPDGLHAWYKIVEDDSPRLGDHWNTLFAVRRDGSHIRRLYAWNTHIFDHRLNDVTLRWAPDNRHILAQTTETGSVDLDGVNLLDFDVETAEQRNLTGNIDGKPGTGKILEVAGYQAFSPDGKYLLLTLGGDRITLCNKRLVRIEYATGKREVLTSAQMTSVTGCWAPNSKEIAFISAPDATAAYESEDAGRRLAREKPYQKLHLYVMAADGSRPRRLTQDPRYFEQRPSWSADGCTITFIRYEVSSKSLSRSLWTIRADGTGLTRVRALSPYQWCPIYTGSSDSGP